MKKYILALALGLGIATQAQVQDFTLPSATGGAAFTLSAAESDYVALHFLLKTECPYCMRHTMTYATRSEELPGVRQVFIKPDTREEIQEWAAKVDGACAGEYDEGFYEETEFVLYDRDDDGDNGGGGGGDND